MQDITRKIAIIGASDLQNPLIEKAKEMGFETHVFAWKAGDIGERTADFFYPLSITEKDLILEECRRIGVCGVCSIASDLANITVAYVANALGLPANPLDAVNRSTNKHLMRETFALHGDPSPRSVAVSGEDIDMLDRIKETFRLPIIVKPVDRSGSRAITKLSSFDGLGEAIRSATDVSFAKTAVVEEFVEGREFSVEFISWQGRHGFLALTEKVTSGAPHFIERAHLEPANVSADMANRVEKVVRHALDSLGVQNGASHSEVKITPSGEIQIIEIGSRMGGDFIGSNLVELSTGVDFVRAVIDVATGVQPDLAPRHPSGAAAVRFVFSQEDINALNELKKTHPEFLVFASEVEDMTHEVVDSASRYGYFLMAAPQSAQLIPYLPLSEDF